MASGNDSPAHPARNGFPHGEAAESRLRALARRVRITASSVRRDLRSNDFFQIFACAVLGAIVGACVDGIHQLIQVLQRLSFELPEGDLLSTGFHAERMRIMIVPAIGGLILGGLAVIGRYYRHREIVDPVEANALYGGRMSLFDSIRLAFAAFLSNVAGASVGMEAGYSQLGAGFFSKVGQFFTLRREDERIFVTAGAGAAIAAAFNAPLAGAFYGFELILGQYTLKALTPVAVAAVAATLTQDVLSHPSELFHVRGLMQIDTESYLLFALLGILSAGIAIVAMLAVTWSERGFRSLKVPYWFRPALGGFALSMVALYFPQVLGSGHGAIQYHFYIRLAFLPLAALVLAKIVASALSIGSGFRGGLFSSSLLLGCVFGGAFAQVLAYFDPYLGQQYNAFVLVGMGSVAAAIIGAPLTMVFLVLEGTGDFPLTMGVLIGVVLASTIVRLSFGYSFSTWRFHQRGLGLRGAHDIGWISDLTVGRMMRADPKVAESTMTIAALRAKYPIGSAKRIFVVSPEKQYLGSFDLAKAHAAAFDQSAAEKTIGELAEKPQAHLFAYQNVRTALSRFDEFETEVMPVFAPNPPHEIVGYLSEAYALKRYTQELERRRSAELGEQDLFSIGPTPSA
jgi:CIC family chloride channel protein